MVCSFKPLILLHITRPLTHRHHLILIHIGIDDPYVKGLWEKNLTPLRDCYHG